MQELILGMLVTRILFRGSCKHAENMVNCLDKIIMNIQFTLKTQIHNKCDILDVTVTVINNKFDFGIHREPTQSDPQDSNHPYTQKISNFDLVFYRLERIRLYSSTYQILM